MNSELVAQALSDSARSQIQHIRYFDAIDSTNAEALRCLRQGDSRSSLLLAGAQEAGRGRRGRTWQSPSGQGIYMSLVRGFEPGQEQLQSLSLVTAISLYEVILSFGAQDLQLKWPNDLYHNNHKLAGILLELYNREEQNFVIFGIGINLQLDPDTVAAIPQPVTDLSSVLSSLPKYDTIVARVMESLLTRLALFEQEGFPAFHETWNSADCFIGEQVVLSDGKQQQQGRSLGVNELGALLLETDVGVQAVTSGELSSLRIGELEQIS